MASFAPSVNLYNKDFLFPRTRNVHFECDAWYFYSVTKKTLEVAGFPPAHPTFRCSLGLAAESG